MGHEEHGGTWHMDAAQLDTQRKKGEAILKTSSTTRPTGRVPQLDRPSFNSIELRSQQSNPKNKRSYNQKSEDCPDGSIENSANRAAGWPRNECFRSAKIVRLKSRPKFDHPADASRPGKQCPAVGQATTTQAMPHEPGSKPRGRATYLVPRPMRRPSREATSRVRPRNIGQSSPVRPQRPTAIRPATTVPIVHDHNPIIRPIVPTDRPNAAVDPKPVLKPDLHIFKARLNPKPPLKT
ncbi:unnamed protein product [Microthlaspi erraticum]|uniref:Uncharacterized protein n=1 Tax=Microthlaspi erraticum TaxID=1685480 RepID=A0A6D2I120_9BRAS|nr:unnamed protein product [Microthlaspi erraticum]